MNKVAQQGSELAEQQPSESAAQWQSAEVQPDGALVLGEIVQLRRSPAAERRTVVFERGGRDLARDTAHFFRFADRAGGTLLLPVRREVWDALRVHDVDGRTVRAGRVDSP
jgi:hypothetical protein